MTYNFPICFFDAPVFDAAVTPIPGSAGSPIEVIADSGVRSAVAIDFIDNTGDFIGVYLGAVGQERLLCIIGNGLNSRSWGVFPAHSRVSLRAMKTAAITNGTLVGTLMSY